MANDIYPAVESIPNGVHADPSLTATLKGILDDAVELGKQQIAMLRAEIRADIRKLLAAVIPLTCGVAPLLLGGLMLCFTLVHLIHWLTTPAGQSLDAANIPLWGCYAIVAGAFLLVGGTLLGIGIYRLKTMPTLGGESAKALEENIQWIMNRNPK
jgi:Putative Actinobacterial Holin-X, holin superfamily III